VPASDPDSDDPESAEPDSADGVEVVAGEAASVVGVPRDGS